MLALEVVLAERSGGGTLVFDEVDAGVGGQAAGEIGRRLAQLARQHQVVVVTHLAQVAAFADRQLRVAKSATDTSTTATVSVLDGDGRVEEIARMLSGQPESEVGREHALDLLEAAADARRQA